MSTTIVSPMLPGRRTPCCPPKLPSPAALIDAIAFIFVVLRRLTGLPGGTAPACPMTVTMLSPKNALMRLGSGASPSPIATITAESRLSMASSAFTSPADKESIAGDNPTNPSRSRRASTASITVSALRSPTAVTSISSRHVQVRIHHKQVFGADILIADKEPPGASNSLSVPKARQIAVGIVVWQGRTVRAGGDDHVL